MTTTALPAGTTEVSDPSGPQLCPVCGSAGLAFGPGPRGRPGARCTRCGALERHRFLAALMFALRDRIDGKLILDIAPSGPINLVIRQLRPVRHLRIDFDPAADGRAVDVQGSLTALPLADQSVDTLICYHVLEHIPDDGAAMREIARVLRKDGLAFVQVPFRANTLTDEDPDAPADERLRRFGQADHVRYYGDDFEDRLQAAGLRFVRIDPGNVVGPDIGRAMNVSGSEYVWLVWPEGSDRAPVDVLDLPQAVLAQLALFWANRYAAQGEKVENLDRRVAKLRRRLARAERQLARPRPTADPSVRAQAFRVVRQVKRRASRLVKTRRSG